MRQPEPARLGRVAVVAAVECCYGADLYDPAADRWTATAAPTAVRLAFTATALPSGHVVVAGGRLTDGAVEIFDPGTGSWASSLH